MQPESRAYWYAYGGGIARAVTAAALAITQSGVQVSLCDAGQGMVALLNPSDGELHRQLKGFVVLEAIDAVRACRASAPPWRGTNSKRTGAAARSLPSPKEEHAFEDPLLKYQMRWFYSHESVCQP
jgi:hypothetical protein